jgi:acetyl-CoA acetyltransferase
MHPNTPCIVGLGETEYRKWGGHAGRSALDLVAEAAAKAAADAGLATRDFDGFVSFAQDATPPQLLHHALGARRLGIAAMAWHPGGGGVCAAVQLAAMAVEAGHSAYALVWRGLQLSPQSRFGRNHESRPAASFNAPFGVFAPATSMALVAQRHMHLHGTTTDHLAEVAMACRSHAHDNPNAVMRGRPMDSATYHASRPIADPLKLFDCCLESDGACALIITTLARARDLRQAPVPILAARTGSQPSMGHGAFGGHNMPDGDFATGNATMLADELFAAAGVRPADIDVAQLYDAFTLNVLLALEDFGIVRRGESGPFVATGALRWPDGALPTNTAGGNLSEAYMHGLSLVIEGARQMRGQARLQVHDARLCLVAGGGVEVPTSGLVLARH